MKKTDATRRLARCALLTALETALLYLSSVAPSGRAALVAVAGVLSVTAVIDYGPARALAVFAASALLALLIVPDKSGVLLFAVFLGYYPILKSIFERPKSVVLSWCLKLALFNAVFWLLWLLARRLLLTELPAFMSGTLVAWLILNVVFVLYDVGLSKLITFYIVRLAGRMGGRK